MLRKRFLASTFRAGLRLRISVAIWGSHNWYCWAPADPVDGVIPFVSQLHRRLLANITLCTFFMYIQISLYFHVLFSYFFWISYNIIICLLNVFISFWGFSTPCLLVSSTLCCSFVHFYNVKEIFSLDYVLLEDEERERENSLNATAFKSYISFLRHILGVLFPGLWTNIKILFVLFVSYVFIFGIIFV